MALYGCSCGMLGSALVAILMLTAPQLLPDIPPLEKLELEPQKSDSFLHNTISNLQTPTTHLYITSALFIYGIIVLLSDLIHRKILENRLRMMRSCLSTSLGRIRLLESKRDQMESTLKIVQNATAEYNLLLYLLQRQRTSVAH